jgi:hypothetical protein
MTFNKERDQFRTRLIDALIERGLSTSPSELTRLLIAHAPGEMMSVTGVRKWMIGETLPRPAKMQVLAKIIGVHSAWLRYGEGPRCAVYLDATLPDREEQRWAVELSPLSESDIVLVREFVTSLLSLQQKSDPAYNA